MSSIKSITLINPEKSSGRFVRFFQSGNGTFKFTGTYVRSSDNKAKYEVENKRHISKSFKEATETFLSKNAKWIKVQ